MKKYEGQSTSGLALTCWKLYVRIFWFRSDVFTWDNRMPRWSTCLCWFLRSASLARKIIKALARFYPTQKSEPLDHLQWRVALPGVASASLALTRRCHWAHESIGRLTRSYWHASKTKNQTWKSAITGRIDQSRIENSTWPPAPCDLIVSIFTSFSSNKASSGVSWFSGSNGKTCLKESTNQDPKSSFLVNEPRHQPVSRVRRTG